MNHLRASLLTALIALGAAVPMHAQDGTASLDVCNKGAVSVEVVVATKNIDLRRGFDKYYWKIEGTPVAPGKCANVYHDVDAGGAYLAFGFYDAKGQWGSGKIAQVPDIGVRSVFLREYPVLKSASKGVCARLDETEYMVNDDPQIDCAGIRLTGGIRKEVGHGAFFPLTSALYFEPEGQNCRNPYHCYGGDYYLNISPSAADRELHAATGTESGADDAKGDGGDSVGTQVLKALAKAAAEERQKQAQRQAQVAAAAPPGGFTRFVDGCNAFYRDPANARLSMSDAPGWCSCLSEQYRNLMTPEEESKYANDYGRLFHGGIAQPYGFGLSKSDPAWPRLHPAVEKCAR